MNGQTIKISERLNAVWKKGVFDAKLQVNASKSATIPSPKNHSRNYIETY